MFARTKNIRLFLASPAFTDQRLAEVYAHCQDGKLCYGSCCCFIGCATANHPLRGACAFLLDGDCHLYAARQLPHADAAESEYFRLGVSVAAMLRRRFERLIPYKVHFWLMLRDDHDARRRTKLLPLLKAELDRRAELRAKENDLWFIRECLKIGAPLPRIWKPKPEEIIGRATPIGAGTITDASGNVREV